MAAQLLLDRRCVVTIAPPLPTDYVRVAAERVTVTGLRAAFSAKKTRDSAPNELELELFNVSDRTRTSAQMTGAKVIVEAGYGANVSQVFIGDIKKSDHSQDGADGVLKILALDSARARKFAHVSESFGAGTTRLDILRRIIALLGVDGGRAIDEAISRPTATPLRNSLSTPMLAGYVVHGRAAAEIDRLLAGTGFAATIQDGRLLLLGPGETVRESVVVLSEGSGLLGSPQMSSGKDKGGPGALHLKCLLNPLIHPGTRVRLQSKSHNGDFSVELLKHTGDTHGQDWFTEMEAVPAR